MRHASTMLLAFLAIAHGRYESRAAEVGGGRRHPDPATRPATGPTSRPASLPATQPGAALEASADWKTIGDAWAATDRHAVYSGTKAERKELEARLDAALEAVGRLASAGSLSKAEAELLKVQAARQRTMVRSNPPTDLESLERAAWNRRASPPPILLCQDSIRSSKPPLEQVLKDGKPRRALLDLVLPAIEWDLGTMGDRSQLKALEHPARFEADALRKNVETTVAELKKQAGIRP